MDFLFDNQGAVVSIILATKMLASAIVSLTKTPKDDKWVSKVYKVVEFAAGMWTRKAKL